MTSPEDDVWRAHELSATHQPFVCVDLTRFNPYLAALSSRNIRYRVDRSGDFPVIWVPLTFAELARRELEACDEQLTRNLSRPAPVDTSGDAFSLPALLVFLLFFAVLARFHLQLVAHGLQASWQALGCWNRDAILQQQQWWRCLTAITLHADVQHLLGNMLFGIIFGSLAATRLGTGVAMLLMLGAGAAANALMTLFPNADHSSIGSSTMVYSLLGLLAATHTRRAWRHCRDRRASWHLAKLLPWLPLASATALGALNGAAPGADILAHLLGFLTGMVVGVVWPPDASPAAKTWQLLAALAALSAPLLAWLVCAPQPG